MFSSSSVGVKNMVEGVNNFVGKNIWRGVLVLNMSIVLRITTPPIHSPVSYRFPRVFVDEFSDNFGDSLTFVTKLVTHLVIASL